MPHTGSFLSHFEFETPAALERLLCSPLIQNGQLIVCLGAKVKALSRGKNAFLELHLKLDIGVWRALADLHLKLDIGVTGIFHIDFSRILNL